MAKKDIGTAEAVTGMTENDSVFIEVGGSLRRIKLAKLRDAISKGGELVLSQIAWGVNIKQATTTTTDWGRCGNLALWEDYKARSGRYLVTPEGKAAKLAPDGTHFTDGSDVDETKGNIMVIAPELHFLWQTDEERGYPVLWCSTVPLGGHSLGGASGGRYMCVGAYAAGDQTTNKLRSGTGYVPKASTTITNFHTYAQNIGKDWGLVNYDYRRWLVMCCLSETGDSNAQAKIGYGPCGSGSSTSNAAFKLTTGETKTLGKAFGNKTITINLDSGGTAAPDASRVCAMYVEDPWGLRWEMTQGIYYGSSTNTPAQTGNECYIYEGNYIPQNGELTTQPSGNYRQIERLTTGSATFISKIIGGEHFDVIPSETNGDSTSKWCDAWWSNTTGQLGLFGGHAYVGASCGFVAANASDDFGNANAGIGSRLAYYGDLTFVNGKSIE